MNFFSLAQRKCFRKVQEQTIFSCAHAYLFVSCSLQIPIFTAIMQAMTDNIRLPDELAQQLKARRKALGMSKSALADRAGKVREVIYRLEAGEESTVSSLFAIMGALGLVMRVEHVGLPTASEVAARFMEDDDAS